MNIALLPVLLISLVVPPQEAPWIEQYQSESAVANKTCAAKEFVECRSHLIRLKDLADGRGDTVYRLAKVEASLGNRATALEWLSLYSKMGLRLADPMTEAAFDSIRDSADFQSDMTQLKAAAARFRQAGFSRPCPRKI